MVKRNFSQRQDVKNLVTSSIHKDRTYTWYSFSNEPSKFDSTESNHIR